MPEARSPTDISEIALDLDRVVLLGAGRQRALGLIAELQAHPALPKDVAAMVLARTAELAAQEQTPDAAELLERASEACTPPRQTSLRLRAVRAWALAQEPDTAAIRFDELFDDGLIDSDQPVPPGELALARAFLGGPHVRAELEAALATLPSPRADADRLDAHLRLADLLHTGGDLARAQRQLEQALALAERHQDDVFLALSAALLGNLMVERGYLDAGRAHLERAMVVAWQRGDGLTTLAAGTVLVALQQRQEDWEAVVLTARAVRSVAAERGHWLALADAALAASTGLRSQGQTDEALAEVLGAYEDLGGVGADAAQRVLQAHLAELRLSLGAEVFDGALDMILGPEPATEEEE